MLKVFVVIIMYASNMQYIEVEIKKPIFGTYVSIDKRKIDEAIGSGKMMRITIPQGSAVVDPREWLRTADNIEKKIINFPSNPMVFVYNTVPIKMRERQSTKQETLFK